MVRLFAPAKLTLSLRITGVREDGFHLLDAEMVSLDLADELEVEALAVEDRGSEDSSLAIDVVEADGGQSIDLVEDNLVARALGLAGRAARVLLTKRIPVGAGLGGGSSDAAAILRWAGFTDLSAAARIGADIPFCMVGGRARVRGIGEIVDPLPFVERTFTLSTPPFGCSTPAVYAKWDELGEQGSPGHNDLEKAALALEPRLAEYRDRLRDVAKCEPMLAGSGSTWFVEGAFPGERRTVVRTIAATSALRQTLSR